LGLSNWRAVGRSGVAAWNWVEFSFFSLACCFVLTRINEVVPQRLKPGFQQLYRRHEMPAPPVHGCINLACSALNIVGMHLRTATGTRRGYAGGGHKKKFLGLLVLSCYIRIEIIYCTRPLGRVFVFLGYDPSADGREVVNRRNRAEAL